MDNYLVQLGQQLGERLLHSNRYIATAESCTGGGVAAAITAIPGSSAWFEYGIVCYANSAKQKLLGVNAATLECEGAVSEAVVIEMARGVLALAEADLAVAISGVAGPGGGSPEKPVGTVWFAWVTKNAVIKTGLKNFEGDRGEIQKQAVVFALEGALTM